MLFPNEQKKKINADQHSVINKIKKKIIFLDFLCILYSDRAFDFKLFYFHRMERKKKDWCKFHVKFLMNFHDLFCEIITLLSQIT